MGLLTGGSYGNLNDKKWGRGGAMARIDTKATKVYAGIFRRNREGYYTAQKAFP